MAPSLTSSEALFSFLISKSSRNLCVWFQNWGPGIGFQVAFTPYVTWAKCSPALGLGVPISEMGCVQRGWFLCTCSFLWVPVERRPLFFLGLRGSPGGVFSETSGLVAVGTRNLQT